MTWDELLEFGKVAYEHKEDVASELDYSIYYDSDSNLFISKMYQNEIPYSSIDESGKGVIDFETGENLANAKELVKSLRVAHDNHAFTTKGTEGTYASNSFQQQECIFTIGSSGGAGYTFPQAGAFDYVVTAVPASNDNPLYISQGPSIALFNRPELTKEENRLSVLYSWKFAKYITSTNINVELCVRGSEGYVPVRESSYATESFLEFLEYGEMYATTARILSDVIDGHYLNTAVFKGSATLRTQVGAIISSVLGNKKIGTEITMEEAIDNAFSTAINAAKLDF